MGLDPASLALSATTQGMSGLLSLISGIGQKKQGKRLLKQIGDETVPQELLDNQTQAKTMANQGLPSEQYQQAMKNIQRQQLMALRGAQDRRGGLAALSGIEQAGNDAGLNLDIANAQQRLANQKYAMGINNQVGNFKHNIWSNKYNYGMGLMGYGNQNLVGGLDRLGAAGIQAGYGLFGSGSKKPYTGGATITDSLIG